MWNQNQDLFILTCLPSFFELLQHHLYQSISKLLHIHHMIPVVAVETQKLSSITDSQLYELLRVTLVLQWFESPTKSLTVCAKLCPHSSSAHLLWPHGSEGGGLTELKPGNLSSRSPLLQTSHDHTSWCARTIKAFWSPISRASKFFRQLNTHNPEWLLKVPNLFALISVRFHPTWLIHAKTWHHL